ncbi:glycerol dehydrogenase [Aerococcaceae bacterium DSM 111020]|nr:glycerol dehydrogenase [Aerococcaceae bacterium DSM 111020]
MVNVFASPSHYVQGKNVLLERTNLIKDLGDKVLLLADDTVWEIIGQDYAKALEESGISVYREAFNGEASDNEIQRVVQIGQDKESNVVIGLGGGKAIDATKAIAEDLEAATVIAPTIASTDAPTSALSVIYSDEGSFERYRFYAQNPDLVLMDSQVIANAPASFLADGIADASATFVEARANTRSMFTTMAGGQQTIASQAIARACRDTLFEYADKALAAVECNLVTPAVEKIIEANTLLSGLGFECAGLSGAHAIHNGFTAVHGAIHEKTHGEKVAYGVLVQLMLEDAPQEELNQYIEFYQRIGMPTTMAEVNLDQYSDEELLAIGKQATAEGETIHSMIEAPTAEDVVSAIKAVDRYVKRNF